MSEGKIFRFILMYTKIIIAFSIKSNNLVGAMEELLKSLKNGEYIERVKPVKRNIRIGPYEWTERLFPCGIIIVDNTTHEEFYQLEFADTIDVVISILEGDIKRLKGKSQ